VPRGAALLADMQAKRQLRRQALLAKRPASQGGSNLC
jgi:hypothetical protein